MKKQRIRTGLLIAILSLGMMQTAAAEPAAEQDPEINVVAQSEETTLLEESWEETHLPE